MGEGALDGAALLGARGCSGSGASRGSMMGEIGCSSKRFSMFGLSESSCTLAFKMPPMSVSVPESVSSESLASVSFPPALNAADFARIFLQID